MIKSWINDVNTTSLRIIVSVFLAAVSIMLVLVAVLLRNWLPTAEQTKVLIGVAGVVLTMMGFDVLQFIGKRFSDATYAAAKNPSQPVSVDTPPVPVAASASDGVGALPAPAQPVARPSAVAALATAVTAGVGDPSIPVGQHVAGEGD